MDCLVTAGVNSFTSLFSGCTVFVYLGYMSVTMQKPIETVASKGNTTLPINTSLQMVLNY